MFKKLASLLFNEEEIVIEEEIAKQEKEEALKIPDLKPIVPKQETRRREKTQTEIKVDIKPIGQPIERPVEKPVEVIMSDDEPRKKVTMINVDEKKEIRKKPDIVVREKAYQPQEVISPYFGGTQETTTPIKKTVTDAKKRSSMTQVISPMFGQVNVEDTNEIEHIDEIMDLDITEMLSPERSEEEVQVSLYDFLEGLDEE